MEVYSYRSPTMTRPLILKPGAKQLEASEQSPGEITDMKTKEGFHDVQQPGKASGTGHDPAVALFRPQLRTIVR